MRGLFTSRIPGRIRRSSTNGLLAGWHFAAPPWPLRRMDCSAFYDIGRLALGTEDGRRLLADSLIGITNEANGPSRSAVPQDGHKR